MLLDNFYTFTIDSNSEQEIIANIDINKNHSVFDGHFPDTPIVPGVIQVLMIKEILSESLGFKVQLESSKSIKFLSMINPNQITSFRAKIKYQKNENIFKVNALLFTQDMNILKLLGNYKKLA